MKKLAILLIFFASPLFAEVQVTLKNQSNIPITAIKKRFGCAKIIRGEMTACSSTNIPAGEQTTIVGSKPFNIAIHHQEKGKNLRFTTKNKVQNGDTLIFPSDSFKVLKGKFPARMQQPTPIPVASPSKPTMSPPLVTSQKPKSPKIVKESNETIVTIYVAKMNTSDEQLKSLEPARLVGLLQKANNIEKQLRNMNNNEKQALNELLQEQNELRKKKGMELLPTIEGMIKSYEELQKKIISILPEVAKEKDVLELTDEELKKKALQTIGNGV